MRNVRYTVILERDSETKLWVATVPALSVSTYGSSRPHALRKAKETVEVTIEGLKATQQPVPSGDEGRFEIIEVAV